VSRNVYTVPLDTDLEQMLISAERYACGRRTYIVGDTTSYLISLLPHMSVWCLDVLKNDMREQAEYADRLGADVWGHACDKEKWDKFIAALDKEIERRVKSRQ